MEIRSLREDELEQAWELDRYSFNAPAQHRDRFLRWDPSRLVGAFDGGRLVAMTGAHELGQFFGGRSVPMGGLASVAVSPDRRGQGVAGRVIVAVLKAMLERGQVISTLFPATTSLYRSLGWEVAGTYLWRRIAPRVLRSIAAPEGGRVRPCGPDEWESLRACYARLAQSVNGFVDRSEHWWALLRDVWSERRVYVAESDGGEIEGYLVYHQVPGEHSAFGGPFVLGVEDAVATGRDAAAALWRLLGSWSSQADRVIYRGSAEDPLLLLLPEQSLEVVAEVRWMTRMVDAAGAVEARGFAPGVDVQVDLALRDPILPTNDGRFVLTVSKGRGRLESGGSGTVALDVGPFSALYTGWASTSVLERAGRLSGGTPEERGALDAAFAGPVPWMLDQF
ncbi:MAG: GNAT family N-acetyltransferase [Myxococcales bacterium]|nr:GNAT family N-acetyltransferase [Myxococcales bacterium]